MKLQLPDLTLVMVETREHALARMAIDDCLQMADFAELLILTDKPELFEPVVHSQTRRRFHYIPDWPDKLGWSRSWWFDVPPLLRTAHTLNIQWDSWISDPSMWRDEFLNYDYIGAPWWYKDGKNVGNGGFSLVSTRLKRYIYDRRGDFPCDTSADDDLLCRTYRPKLEDAGFRWAPEKVAQDFAFEGCGPEPREFGRHFGFHAMFNWPHVLDCERLQARLEIALGSQYIRDGYMLKALCQQHPDIMSELSNNDGSHPKEPACGH